MYIPAQRFTPRLMQHVQNTQHVLNRVVRLVDMSGYRLEVMQVSQPLQQDSTHFLGARAARVILLGLHACRYDAR